MEFVFFWLELIRFFSNENFQSKKFDSRISCRIFGICDFGGILQVRTSGSDQVPGLDRFGSTRSQARPSSRGGTPVRNHNPPDQPPGANLTRHQTPRPKVNPGRTRPGTRTVSDPDPTLARTLTQPSTYPIH